MKGSYFTEVKMKKKEILYRSICDEFIAKPYESITITGIAQKAGVSRSSLYLHFQNKKEILIYMAEETGRRVQSKFFSFLNAAQGKLDQGAAAFLRWLLQNKEGERICQIWMRLRNYASFQWIKDQIDIFFWGMDKRKNLLSENLLNLIQMTMMVTERSLFYAMTGAESMEAVQNIAQIQYEMLEKRREMQ